MMKSTLKPPVPSSQRMLASCMGLGCCRPKSSNHQKVSRSPPGVLSALGVPAVPRVRMSVILNVPLTVLPMFAPPKLSVIVGTLSRPRYLVCEMAVVVPEKSNRNGAAWAEPAIAPRARATQRDTSRSGKDMT